MSISIVGLGFVGNSMYESFKLKGLKENINLFIYDKYKNGGIGKKEDIIKTGIIFLALPTVYDEKLGEYNKNAIYELCDYLSNKNYNGSIIIKSTIEPETTDKLSTKYTDLHFIHNPEFLTARTAFEDFHNQKHIVLGIGPTCPINKYNLVKEFYYNLYPEAYISECKALESESMKIFCNCFYSVKIQFFTELYLLCKKNNSDFDKIKDMMLKNNWINPMHTNIPGNDGNISYGGLCFPKDTNALNKYMIKKNIPNLLLDSTIKERNSMRNDNDSIINQLQS